MNLTPATSPVTALSTASGVSEIKVQGWAPFEKKTFDVTGDTIILQTPDPGLVGIDQLRLSVDDGPEMSVVDHTGFCVKVGQPFKRITLRSVSPFAFTAPPTFSMIVSAGNMVILSPAAN